MHEKVDGVQVGQHPMVTRLLKGVIHERPRYSSTWNARWFFDGTVDICILIIIADWSSESIIQKFYYKPVRALYAIILIEFVPIIYSLALAHNYAKMAESQAR